MTDAHMDWTDDLAGGILFQDDHSYPGQDIRTTPGQSPYTDRVQAQDRFVNLTYRSPSVIHETTHHPRGHRGQLMGQHQLIHHGHPMSTPIRSAGGLIRGLSLGELSPRSPEVALTPFDFDTKKVATHGTLKRLKLVKSPTDTQLFVPNQALTLEHLGTNESMLTSLTADFDEKMKLLLDPNYSGGSQSDTSSVQSTPSKKYTHPNLRRISEQPQRPPTKPLQPPPGQKNNRSLSLGEDSPGNQIPTPATIQQQSPLATISGAGPEQARSNKKSELKRGRVVDKHHPPKNKTGNGQDEKENLVKSMQPANNNQQQPNNNNPRMKMKNRKLRRRHTVGGTKDFSEFDLIEDPAASVSGQQDPDLDEYQGQYPHQLHPNDLLNRVGGPQDGQNTELFNHFLFHPASQYHHSVMQNVDRSLGQWIRRHQKMGKSSPDLSLIGRRLSLPDSVLAAAFQPFTTSLLESQV